MTASGDDQLAAMPQITDMDSYTKFAKNPLIRMADMTTDMREEAVDIVGMAVEKHVADLEKCAQVRSFGSPDESLYKLCMMSFF